VACKESNTVETTETEDTAELVETPDYDLFNSRVETEILLQSS